MFVTEKLEKKNEHRQTSVHVLSENNWFTRIGLTRGGPGSISEPRIF
jgi:hypothetical protein